MITPEEIGRAIWDDQRRRLKTQDCLAAKAKWRDSSIPDQFWQSFVHDGEAVMRLLHGEF